MKTFPYFRAFPVLVLLFTSVLFSGCAKPPTQEVENAKKAIADAKQKEADLYVQDIFTKAEDALKTAEGLIVEKKYKEAKVAAEEAVTFALQSISQVEMNKSKLKEETELMILDAQKLMDEVKAAAATAIKKKALIQRDEVQSAIGNYELEMLGVKDDLQAQRIRQAHDRLLSIMEQMKSQKESINTALEQK